MMEYDEDTDSPAVLPKPDEQMEEDDVVAEQESGAKIDAENGAKTEEDVDKKKELCSDYPKKVSSMICYVKYLKGHYTVRKQTSEVHYEPKKIEISKPLQYTAIQYQKYYSLSYHYFFKGHILITLLIPIMIRVRTIKTPF